ncbi:ATP-binding protein [Caldisericum exile]|uniref:Uncharacterized protein n=1 Tax=Caldisericum exile (strain DSM 21853 / NBRC 104410 / AZM16c01) TaxID=511051 RepID=A0A7U6JFF7_CALEA|nr:ATP-binding protein [Caldisericum exile]BAL80389.1 hypothetical protein CSE_02630 [Caldisericum exile AZM16c01]
MKDWKEVLLDRSLPSPIPPPPYSNLEQSFGFLDRENEIKEFLDLINKAVIEHRGFLIFLLGDQGKGKTTFLKYIKENYFYPSKDNSDKLFVSMHFPQELSELDFSFIFTKYIGEIVNSGLIDKLRDRVVYELNSTLGLNLEYTDKNQVIDFLTKVKNLVITLPKNLLKNMEIITFVISSYIYYPEIQSFIDYGEQPNNQFLGLLKHGPNEVSVSKIYLFSKFLRDFMGIKHTVFSIDDFDILERNENVYRTLYKLLMSFRNANLVEEFSIVLSGSVSFYEEFIQSLSQNERQRIENWGYPIFFESLDTKDVLDLIKRSFSNFWMNYNVIPPDNPYGVFSSDSISFLYTYTNKDIRETLRKLYDLINEMRSLGNIVDYSDVKKIISKFKVDKVGLKDVELNYFKNLLIEKVKLFKSSDFINEKLKDAFNKLIKYYESRSISIRAEKEVNINGSFADVLLTVNKINEGMRYEIIFEVKIKDSEVSEEEISSRINLIKGNERRYLYWISRSKLHELDYTDGNDKKRILRDTPLTETEIAYLSYLVHIPEIFGWDKFEDNDLELILKQSGINMDLILNLQAPKEDKPSNIYALFEEILDRFLKEEKIYVLKKTVLREVRGKGFKDFSDEYLMGVLSEVAHQKNLRITDSQIRFDIKKI